jgi:hypothetical protein
MVFLKSGNEANTREAVGTKVVGECHTSIQVNAPPCCAIKRDIAKTENYR